MSPHARLMLPIAFLSCAAVQAATVNVQMDVTNMTRWDGQLVGDGLVWKQETSRGPTSLNFGFRFEIEDPQPGTAQGPLGEPMSAVRFSGVEIGQSFYSVMASDMGVTDFDTGLIYAWAPGSTSYLDARTTGSIASASDVGRLYDYWRGLHWNLPGQAFDHATFFPFLQAQIGQTIAGGFSEGYVYQTTKLVDVDGTLQASTNPVDRLTWSTFKYVGDVTVKSVSYVPEPGSMVLAAIGLSVAFVAARRRRA